MTSMWAWMAHYLRLYRMRQKMTQDDLGRVLGCVKSTVSRLESAQLQLDLKQVVKLDALWNTQGHFARILEYARRAHDPDWIRQHADAESRATEIKTFEALVVPGLLQTPEYSRDIFVTGGAADDIDDRVLEESHRANVSIRVVPRSCGLHAGLGGSFKILYHELGDVAYSEAQFGGRLVVSATEVRGLAVQYDRIGAHAFPESHSRELIKRDMEAIS
jgi:transcriptional regulator with XRE-family HTH domain